MIEERRAAQPDAHTLLAAKEQAFGDETVNIDRDFAREEANAIVKERGALAMNGKRSSKKRVQSRGNS